MAVRSPRTAVNPFELFRSTYPTIPLLRELFVRDAVEAETAEVLPVAALLAENGVAVIFGDGADAAYGPGVGD